jgi:predicted Zn-dependent protease
MAPLLMRGDVAGALALHDRLLATKPDSLSFAEQELNGLGYALLRHGQAAMAVVILERNTERFPDSANAWDSLAEARLAASDTAAAKAAWRTALERVPGDPRLDEERRRALQARARAGLGH